MTITIDGQPLTSGEVIEVFSMFVKMFSSWFMLAFIFYMAYKVLTMK